MPQEFDNLAGRYDDWGKTLLGRITEGLERRLLSELAGPVEGLRVLDVGCGTGTWALELARNGAQVTGLDASPAMLEVARRKAAGAGFRSGDATAAGWVQFVQGDARRLPFPEAGFDLVTSVLMLEWSGDPVGVWREMARVVRPGGRVVAATLNRYSLWTLNRRLAGWWRPSVYSSARFLGRGELVSQARQAGLRVKQVVSAIHYPPVNRSWLLSTAPWWEAVGRRLWPGLGAFLALETRRFPGGEQPEQGEVRE